MVILSMKISSNRLFKAPLVKNIYTLKNSTSAETEADCI